MLPGSKSTISPPAFDWIPLVVDCNSHVNGQMKFNRIRASTSFSSSDRKQHAPRFVRACIRIQSVDPAGTRRKFSNELGFKKTDIVLTPFSLLGKCVVRKRLGLEKIVPFRVSTLDCIITASRLEFRREKLSPPILSSPLQSYLMVPNSRSNDPVGNRGIQLLLLYISVFGGKGVNIIDNGKDACDRYTANIRSAELRVSWSSYAGTLLSSPASDLCDCICGSRISCALKPSRTARRPCKLSGILVLLDARLFHIWTKSAGSYSDEPGTLLFSKSGILLSPSRNSLMRVLTKVRSGFRTTPPALSNDRCFGLTHPSIKRKVVWRDSEPSWYVQLRVIYGQLISSAASESPVSTCTESSLTD